MDNNTVKIAKEYFSRHLNSEKKQEILDMQRLISETRLVDELPLVDKDRVKSECYGLDTHTSIEKHSVIEFSRDHIVIRHFYSERWSRGAGGSKDVSYITWYVKSNHPRAQLMLQYKQRLEEIESFAISDYLRRIEENKVRNAQRLGLTLQEYSEIVMGDQEEYAVAAAIIAKRK